MYTRPISPTATPTPHVVTTAGSSAPIAPGNARAATAAADQAMVPTAIAVRPVASAGAGSARRSRSRIHRRSGMSISRAGRPRTRWSR
ncbi:hypothetical protein ACFDTO_20730 [Microbacteriaceae bacterium 4G12]